jgi:hypothetical protein
MEPTNLNSDDIANAKAWAEGISWKSSEGWRAVCARLANEVDRLQRGLATDARDARLEMMVSMREIEFPNGDALAELVFALESGDTERIAKAKTEARKQAEKHMRLVRYA